jgi:hypothetical protein
VDLEPLSFEALGSPEDELSPRCIHGAGFTMHAKVADLIMEGNWRWPIHWIEVYPRLREVACPSLNQAQDSYCWKMGDTLNQFSTSLAWNSIRYRLPEVPWVKVVWYTQCILKFSFFLWLVLQEKLRTQDRIRAVNIKNRNCMNLMCCLLCYSDSETHRHLFF